MKKIRDSLSEESRRQADRMIMEKVTDLEAFRTSDLVYTYVSFGSEVSTREIMARCLEENKCLAAPRIEGKEMKFFRVKSLEELVPGIWGIPEPAAGAQEVKEAGIMLVPGLAFDKKGYRLGYGGGYYDRYLSARPDLAENTIGLAYQAQLVDKVPSQEYDLPVKKIVTE